MPVAERDSLRPTNYAVQVARPLALQPYQTVTPSLMSGNSGNSPPDGGGGGGEIEGEREGAERV